MTKRKDETEEEYLERKRRKSREAYHNRMQDSEYRARILAANREKRQLPEAQKRDKDRRQNPERKLRNREYMRSIRQDPEQRERHLEYMRNRAREQRATLDAAKPLEVLSSEVERKRRADRERARRPVVAEARRRRDRERSQEPGYRARARDKERLRRARIREARLILAQLAEVEAEMQALMQAFDGGGG